MKERGYPEVCQRRKVVEERFIEDGEGTAAQQRQKSSVKQRFQTNRQLLKLFT